ncbi:protein SLOW WALKER 2 [Silene latifolia]|uniref:protein SLOW WALKER 2 n=1 Tax=Silene latifolia TaxID=37657 RepID=UPI003D787A10
MATSKQKKSSQPKPKEDLQSIQNDVASFASSLGLASSPSLPSSGFNDTDFRPKKKIPQTKSPQSNNPKKPFSQKPDSQKPISKFSQKTPKNDTFNKPKPKPTPKPKPEFDVSNSNLRSFEKFKNLPKLPLVKAGALGTWYMDQSELEDKVLGVGEARKKIEIRDAEEWKKTVSKKKELGERLLAQYIVDYEGSRGQTGDIKMLIATQKSGTAVDKVSAYSVLIGDNPIANMRSLDALLALVTSKVGKRHALTAFDALKELFVESLLPDRKLKTLFQQPLNHLPENKDGHSLLLFWYWEDCLKSRYERFVSALEEGSKDMLRILKDKSLKTMYALLKSKSEQERRLLKALVNKLGDPDNKAASNADFYLTNLLSDHPNMKIVVIDEVDSFLFRPHLGLRSKYHAINFLSQIRLSHHRDGPKVAKRLVDVYFALFKVLVSGTGDDPKVEKSKEKKKSSAKDNKGKDASESHVELDSRLLSALLTGVNRAFPFVSGDEADEVVDVQTPVLFRLVHSQNFNVGIQALMLLDKISSKNQVVSDRFYRALYAKLLLPAALNTSKAEMFIGVLLRAMKNDINVKRVAAFAKRVLQVALQQPPQYACGCLFLLSEVLKGRPPLWNMAIQNEAADDDLEHFEDVLDDSEDEPRKGAKILEITNVDEGRSNALNSDGNSSEDDEAFSASSEEDISDEDGDFVMKSVDKPLESSSTKLADHSGNKLQPSKKHLLPDGYDPRHREPSFCNADRTGWWELTVLASHAHPSVSTMARTLLSGATIVYNGNPLNDLTLTAFLDKFMEKKPKLSTWHGGSNIEPAKKLEMNKHLIGSEILSLAEADVAPEDLVFHKFYMNKTGSSKKLKKKKKKRGAEDEEAAELYGGDESDNDEIENMLDANEPPLDAEADYNSDDLNTVVDEDDDDLIGDASDNDMEMDGMSDSGDEAREVDFDDGDDLQADDSDDVSDEDIKIGDADDVTDEEEDDLPVVKKGKNKPGKKSSASPFASLDEYEHLMNDDDFEDEKVDEDVKVKKRKHSSTKNEGDEKDNKGDNTSRKNKRKKKKSSQ